MENAASEPPPPGEGPFRCTFCAYMAPHFADLMRHMQVHTQQEEPFHCPERPMAFTENDHVATHFMGKGTGESPAKLVRIDQPRRHAVRKEAAEQVFQLSESTAGFLRKDQQKADILCDGTGELPFRHCERPSVFVQKDELTANMRGKSGELPYKCPECPMTSLQKYNLKVHIMRHHAGERPHQCPECPKAYVRTDCLIMHMRSHSGERPFKCSECPMAFFRKGDLRKHITRKHTGQ